MGILDMAYIQLGTSSIEHGSLRSLADALPLEDVRVLQSFGFWCAILAHVP